MAEEFGRPYVTAGNMTLSIYFDISKDPALAQTDVLNRVNTALPQVPQSVRNQGVNIQQKSSSIMMVAAIKDPENKYDLTELSTFANITNGNYSNAFIFQFDRAEDLQAGPWVLQVALQGRILAERTFQVTVAR